MLCYLVADEEERCFHHGYPAEIFESVVAILLHFGLYAVAAGDAVFFIYVGQPFQLGNIMVDEHAGQVHIVAKGIPCGHLYGLVILYFGIGDTVLCEHNTCDDTGY